MKQFFVKHKTGALVTALLLVTTILFAESFYTLIIDRQIRMKNGSVQHFEGTSYERFWGVSYIHLGDSAYIDFGTSVARKDSFTTTSAKDTITMKGASLSDGYIVTPITTLTSATPDTGSQQYYAYHLNGDSVVVARTLKNVTGSTLKSAALYTILRVK